MNKPVLLHAEPIVTIPFTGRVIAKNLQSRAAEIVQLATGIEEPPVSIVIRTRNNRQYIKSLMEDIKHQVYSAPVEVILVDTESSDHTVSIAKQYGAEVVTIKQADFTYPKALNLGFGTAKHPYVMSLVGHSNLSNIYTLKSLAYWSNQDGFGGMFCTPLVNYNASWVERFTLGVGLSKRYRLAKYEEPDSTTMGILGANGAIVKRSVWKEMGGFDEAYAGGGEDAALGHKMMANGYSVVREPLCAVLHSHGLGLIDSAKQMKHWMSLAKPTPFEASKIFKRRPDLRS